jgi:N,N'-diacetylchitobiose transport system permease protein
MTSASQVPSSSVAGSVERPARRRRFGVRIGRGAVPYALLLPTALVLGAVLAYPLYLMTTLSFQRYGLFELIQEKGTWVGLENFSRILHDDQFWDVLVRTVVFTFVNVSLTMILGTLVALLLVQLGPFMRFLVTTALVFAWATPVVVAVTVWKWMVDYDFGVFNWVLTELGVGDYFQHDWFANPTTGFAIITAVVVWGAIPFVAITLYAGLSQVPQELVEAASIDGAGAFRVFRDITLPLLKPIFVILTSLSIIWDFQVFNQVYIMRDLQPSEDYFLISLYAYTKAFGLSEYGLGSAIALTMVVALFVLTSVLIRQMVRMGDVR